MQVQIPDERAHRSERPARLRARGAEGVKGGRSRRRRPVDTASDRCATRLRTEQHRDAGADGDGMNALPSEVARRWKQSLDAAGTPPPADLLSTPYITFICAHYVHTSQCDPHPIMAQASKCHDVRRFGAQAQAPSSEQVS
eukprot:scaffold16074_cov114-Isochrysis_galbana.AAC.2